MSQFFINPDVDSPIRFDLQKFLDFSDNLDPLTAAILSDIKKLNNAGFFVIQGEEYRPDAISFKVYGNHQYWWVIMAYNDISDVNALVAGVSLKYPALSDLEDIYFSLKSRQTGQGA